MNQKNWKSQRTISDFPQISYADRTLDADSKKLNFIEIGWGFAKLWTIQNDYFLWSMNYEA